MRPLRWKSRYRTGDLESDRHNRAFLDCLNRLIGAAGQREHCREMEEFIGQFSAAAEEILAEQPTGRDLSQEFGRRLLASLPLGPYGGNACRKCGLCDLAREEIAEHLHDPAECLFERKTP
jgi:hypothetical protein